MVTESKPQLLTVMLEPYLITTVMESEPVLAGLNLMMAC